MDASKGISSATGPCPRKLLHGSRTVPHFPIGAKNVALYDEKGFEHFEFFKLRPKYSVEAVRKKNEYYTSQQKRHVPQELTVH
jgi:hypothetical protein